MQTVYIDLFFLINFSMDFLCLYLVARLLSEKIRPLRFVFAASFGGVYACLSLFSPLSPLPSLLCDAAGCVLLSIIAFAKRGRVRSVFGTAIVYTAVSAVLGGFMTALFNFFNRIELDTLISGGEAAEDGISVWLLLLAATAGGIITKLCSSFFRSRSMRKFADLDICFDGKSTTLRAMTDSGNLLCEPISGRRCIVADTEKLSSVLPREIISAVRKKSAVAVATLPEKYARRVCIIPTRTATGEGTLIGVRVDKISIADKGGRRELDAIVVPADINRSAEGSDALIPSELLI